MKKLIPFLLLLLTFTSFSQSLEKLKTDAAKMFEANYLMDFEIIASYAYPKIIENVSRDGFMNKVEADYANEAFRFRYQLEKVPFKLGSIQKINSQTFCVVRCKNPVRYTYEQKLSEMEVMMQKIMLEDANASKEIVFEPKRNSFNIRRNSTFLAVMDETTNGEWKFFNLDHAFQWGELRAIFGETVIKELGL